MGSTDPAYVGPFRVVGVLGQGGMGRVLLGAGPDGRLVAVKQVHERFARDDGFRARFRREVAASRRVSGAYTAAVIDSDADAATPWLASVFVSGPSLGSAVESAGVLSEEPLRRLAAGLASALAEIHREGLIHRDLKPDNVLLAEDGVRVVDFGIARAVDGEGSTGLTRTGWVIGSPAFMSPEQAESREPTPAADVFSLGSVLVMAATGNSPFAGASTLQTLYDVVHAVPDLSGVPSGLRPVVERCLAKDPADRPTAAGLLDLLGPVAPAGRQWPPAVHAMASAQRAEIDRLLGGGAPAAAQAPEPEPQSEPQPHAEPGPEPDPGPRPEQRPDPDDFSERATEEADPGVAPQVSRARPGPGSRGRAAWAAGAVLAVGIAVVAASLWLKDPGGSPKGKAAATASSTGATGFGTYTQIPTCEEMAGKLPKGRTVAKDRHTEQTNWAQTSCVWQAAGPAEPPTEVVLWGLLLSGYGVDDASDEQQRRFNTAWRNDGMRETGLGVGGEAYWTDKGSKTACALAVRDRNLTVNVTHAIETGSRSSCEQDAKALARTALAAVPH
ncbi:serine/threonine-protein kinase [Streptomyces sp. NPDC097981]|uniref:serine/threonine-protein kinase n=1 Tax=Streptomyces sp. NPDC097981 TaxID=3155428 RepID=UPI0033264B29